jgi:hypothetical protein
MNGCSVGWRIDHGIWPPLCACCGSTTGTEDHHLYLRSEGCPDDLTVWLCHICARGVKLGNPKLTENLDRAVASTKAEADRFARNILPIIREIQASGSVARPRRLPRCFPPPRACR